MEPHNGAYTLLTVRFYAKTQSIYKMSGNISLTR